MAPLKNDRPGIKWIRNFEKRHSDKLTRRVREGLNYKRCKNLTKANVNKFYDLYEELINKYKFKPGNIWNADESSFQASEHDAKV